MRRKRLGQKPAARKPKAKSWMDTASSASKLLKRFNVMLAQANKNTP